MKMIVLFAVVIIVVGYVVYVVYPIRVALQKTQPLMAAAVPYQQSPTDATLHILVAGDSTAVGTGASTPSDSIAGRIGADYPFADVTNIGVNGAKLSGLQNTLTAKLKTPGTTTYYDLIVLQIGANDITGFTPLSKVSSELQSVLALARDHASHVVVLTAGDVGSAAVFRFPLTLLLKWRTLQVRSVFLRETGTFASATPDVKYVDLYADVPAGLFDSDIPKYYAADHFHPSSDGYGVWYHYVGPVIQKELASMTTATTTPGV